MRMISGVDTRTRWETRTSVSLHMIANILRRRIIRRITANICVSFPLINPHIIHLHDRREDHRRQVNCLPILWDSYVEDNGLRNSTWEIQPRDPRTRTQETHHRFLRNQPLRDTRPICSLIRANSSSTDSNSRCSFSLPRDESLIRVFGVWPVLET